MVKGFKDKIINYLFDYKTDRFALGPRYFQAGIIIYFIPSENNELIRNIGFFFRISRFDVQLSFTLRRRSDSIFLSKTFRKTKVIIKEKWGDLLSLLRS